MCPRARALSPPACVSGPVWAGVFTARVTLEPPSLAPRPTALDTGSQAFRALGKRESIFSWMIASGTLSFVHLLTRADSGVRTAHDLRVHGCVLPDTAP